MRYDEHSFRLVIACLSPSIVSMRSLGRQEATRMQINVRTLCARQGNIMVPRRVYVGLVGSSFLYLYRRGNGRGARLSRTLGDSEERELVFAVAAHQRRSSLKPPPLLRIMSSFVSPLLANGTGIYSCASHRKGRKREREKNFLPLSSLSILLPMCRLYRHTSAFSSTMPLKPSKPS